MWRKGWKVDREKERLRVTVDMELSREAWDLAMKGEFELGQGRELEGGRLKAALALMTGAVLPRGSITPVPFCGQGKQLVK